MSCLGIFGWWPRSDSAWRHIWLCLLHGTSWYDFHLGLLHLILWRLFCGMRCSTARPTFTRDSISRLDSIMACVDARHHHLAGNIVYLKSDGGVYIFTMVTSSKVCGRGQVAGPVPRVWNYPMGQPHSIESTRGWGGPYIYDHGVVDSFGERLSALAVLELGSRKLVW